MNKQTLVLNKDYTPLYVVPIERGFTLEFKNRVEVINRYESTVLRSPSTEIYAPSIVRVIEQYVQRPRGNVSLTRSNIYKRDNHECVYCGSQDNLTLDHVKPKSRGGKNTWKNLVTACKSCNQTKGDKPLSEVKDILGTGKEDLDIYRPTYFSIFKNMATLDESWKPYVFH